MYSVKYDFYHVNFVKIGSYSIKYISISRGGISYSIAYEYPIQRNTTILNSNTLLFSLFYVLRKQTLHEQKFDNFSSKFKLEDVVQLVAQACATAVCKAMHECTNELEEKRTKVDNVVVFGLAEKNDDVNDVKSLFDSVDGLNGDMVSSVWRDEGSRSALHPERPALLKVKTSSQSAKKKIIDAARAKCFPHGLYVRRDLTYRERCERRQAAAERAGGQYTAGMYPTVDISTSIGGNSSHRGRGSSRGGPGGYQYGRGDARGGGGPRGGLQHTASNSFAGAAALGVGSGNGMGGH